MNNAKSSRTHDTRVNLLSRKKRGKAAPQALALFHPHLPLLQVDLILSSWQPKSPSDNSRGKYAAAARLNNNPNRYGKPGHRLIYLFRTVPET